MKPSKKAIATNAVNIKLACLDVERPERGNTCFWLAFETMLGVMWQPAGCPMWGLLTISTRYVTTWLPGQASYGAALESNMTQGYTRTQQRANVFGLFCYPRSRAHCEAQLYGAAAISVPNQARRAQIVGSVKPDLQRVGIWSRKSELATYRGGLATSVGSRQLN